MIESKNPFAKRNDKIITINDLSENEKGLSCNCTCPVCNGTFIARMGEVRTWHFAHSGEPCDAAKQIVNSAYQLAKEAVLNKGYITYPGLYVFFDRLQFFRSYYESLRAVSFEKKGYEKLFSEGKMSVQSAEIVSDNRGISTALILNEKLAIRLSIDTEYCIEKNIVRYEDLPTLRIDIDDAIYSEKSEKLHWLIVDSLKNKRWIYSPKVDHWIEPLEQERIKKYSEYLERERIKKEKELEREREKKEQAEKWREQEYREDLLAIKENAIKKQAAYNKPRYNWCYICKRQIHPDEGTWGEKTGKYYCYKCMEEKNLDWRKI